MDPITLIILGTIAAGGFMIYKKKSGPTRPQKEQQTAGETLLGALDRGLGKIQDAVEFFETDFVEAFGGEGFCTLKKQSKYIDLLWRMRARPELAQFWTDNVWELEKYIRENQKQLTNIGIVIDNKVRPFLQAPKVRMAQYWASRGDSGMALAINSPNNSQLMDLWRTSFKYVQSQYESASKLIRLGEKGESFPSNHPDTPNESFMWFMGTDSEGQPNPTFYPGDVSVNNIKPGAWKPSNYTSLKVYPFVNLAVNKARNGEGQKLYPVTLIPRQTYWYVRCAVIDESKNICRYGIDVNFDDLFDSQLAAIAAWAFFADPSSVFDGFNKALNYNTTYRNTKSPWYCKV